MTEQEGDSGSEDILDRMSDLFNEIDDLCEGVDHDLLDIKDTLLSKRAKSRSESESESEESKPSDKQGSDSLSTTRPTGPQRLSFQRRSFRSAHRRKQRGLVPTAGEPGGEKPEAPVANKTVKSEEPPPKSRPPSEDPEESRAEPKVVETFVPVEDQEAPSSASLQTAPGHTVAIPPEDLEENDAPRTMILDPEELSEEEVVAPGDIVEEPLASQGSGAFTQLMVAGEELESLEADDSEEQLAPGDIEAALMAPSKSGGVGTQLMGAASSPPSDVFESFAPKEEPEEPEEPEPEEPEPEAVEKSEEPPVEEPDAVEPLEADEAREPSDSQSAPKRLDEAMAEIMTTASKPAKAIQQEDEQSSESARPAVIDTEMIALLQKSKKPKKEAAQRPAKPRVQLTVHPGALEESFNALLAVDEAQLVCVFTFEEKLTLRHIQGIDPEDLPKIRPLFDSTLETETSQLVLDTFKERGFEEAIGFFRSGVSVPVLAQEQLVAVLFVGSDKPGALAYGAVKKLEILAQELAARFERAAPEQRRAGSLVQAVKLPETNPVKFLAGAAVLIGVAILWTLAGTYHGATTRSPRPTPTVNEKIVLVEKASPEVLSVTLLREMKFRRWAQTHQMLSPQLQQSVTEEELTQLLADWVEDSGHRWDLDSRRPVVLKTGENYVTVSIEPGPQTKGKKPWSWVFVKEDTGWKLFEMKGPLKLSPKV